METEIKNSDQTVKKQSLRDLIREKRMAASKMPKQTEQALDDPYKPSYDFKSKKKLGTLYAYEPGQLHYNIWDPHYPECPTRSITIHDQMTKAGILSKVSILDNSDTTIKMDGPSLLSLAHSREYIDKLRSICMRNSEKDSEMYDSIYYNQMHSYTAALKTATLCATMAHKIMNNEYTNGFANIRPPGHHAMYDEPNGYCLINNIAISAEYLLSKKLAKKILIIDYDVHHGQATQDKFYKRNDVLYFSIHRYERGLFWPNLERSNFTYIGEDKGKGFNINVPLNEIGATDIDYIAIIHNILLPIAYEFQPDIILISAGYDAALGCPEGQMKLTPAFYGHLITSLSGLANGRILCLLEGGYFAPSTAESAVETIRALLGYACNPVKPCYRINPAVIDTINDVKKVLKPYWKCFQLDFEEDIRNPLLYDTSNFHVAIEKYKGEQCNPPYPITRYEELQNHHKEYYENKLSFIISNYKYNQYKVGCLFSERSALHHGPSNSIAQEKNVRVTEIMKKMKEFELIDRMADFDSLATEVLPNNIKQIHDSDYIDQILDRTLAQKPDLYTNEYTAEVCLSVITTLLKLAAAIHVGQIHGAIGVVRPPGHHARKSQGGGFCLINNVAILANHLTKELGYQRVLIIDFDVHHGDGTQEITYNRQDIMYISLHRFDDGQFFPQWPQSNFNFIGKGKSAGFNVNIPFNKVKMENADYLCVWFKIVLPLAYSYDPQIIIVSAGFDAGINDPLGNYNISPETFAHFVQTLKPIAPMMLVLEGGYNTETTSLAMTMCTKTLLGEPIPVPKFDTPKLETAITARNVINVLKPYWPVLQVNKTLGTTMYKQEDIDDIRENLRGNLLPE